mmetsp:Transcript_49760/g.90101  ORF Transcript_49760/g.90101 Transcript_49760/m.90101 type:complete len:83 (-) Transcript_49760:6-254(-)
MASKPMMSWPCVRHAELSVAESSGSWLRNAKGIRGLEARRHWQIWKAGGFQGPSGRFEQRENNTIPKAQLPASEAIMRVFYL